MKPFIDLGATTDIGDAIDKMIAEFKSDRYKHFAVWTVVD